MGKRGPAPKPSSLNDLMGNPGKRAGNKAEPQPKKGRPTMPAWLGKEAKAEWRRVVPELDRIGMLAIVDRSALAAYCQAHAELVEATKTLEAEGRIVDVPILGRKKEDGETVVIVLGHKQALHPAVKLQRDAFGRVKQFLAEFGLTPSSRSRLRVEGGEKKADPFEAFLNGQSQDN